MILLLALLACGETPTVPDISLYDQTCSVDADCLPVFTGDVCGCDCTQAGINASEMDAWWEVQAEMGESCGEVLSCAACPDSVSVCSEGICVVEEMDTGVGD